MFFTITRLALAAAAPALIFAQSLTTYSITISGQLHTIVLPTPRTSTTTVVVTRAALTVTSIVPASVETRTFTVTGPAAVVSGLQPSLPQSVHLVDSEVPGPIVPITIYGYTTSIQLPASASIPTGPVTVAPLNVIAPTPAVASPAVIAASQASAGAKSAASQKPILATNVAGSSATVPAATGAFVTIPSDLGSTISNIASIVTHEPIPIVPLTASGRNAASAASRATASAAAGASSAAAQANSVASEELSSAIASASSAAERASFGASQAASGASTALTVVASSTTVVASTATAETAPSATMATSNTTSASASTETTMSSAVPSTGRSATSEASSAPPSSSSQTPRASSTAAPTSGAASRQFFNLGAGLVAGLIALVQVI